MGNSTSDDFLTQEGKTTDEGKEKIRNYLIEKGISVDNDVIEENTVMYERAITTVRKHFQGSRSSAETLDRVARILEKIGCDADNTLFAQSICPDEINHEDGDITALMSAHLGEVFHMGGLAGVPFTGKTGFAAFSHHIPDGGNLFILFAPHVGLSKQGKVGEYSRFGQSHDGKACGAACAALSHCLAGKHIPTCSELGADPFDYQQQYIISELAKRLPKIVNPVPFSNPNNPTAALNSSSGSKDDDYANDANATQAALAFQMYDIVKTFLDHIITTDFVDDSGDELHGRLILMGGLQINMPSPMDDHFLPLVFEVRRRGQETVSLLDEAFSDDTMIYKPDIRSPKVQKLTEEMTELTLELVRRKSASYRALAIGPSTARDNVAMLSARNHPLSARQASASAFDLNMADSKTPRGLAINTDPPDHDGSTPRSGNVTNRSPTHKDDGEYSRTPKGHSMFGQNQRARKLTLLAEAAAEVDAKINSPS